MSARSLDLYKQSWDSVRNARPITIRIRENKYRPVASELSVMPEYECALFTGAACLL